MESLRAGIKLQMQGLTTYQLSESVEMVLNNPSFKEVALNMKESFRKSGGYKEVVGEILIFVGQ